MNPQQAAPAGAKAHGAGPPQGAAGPARQQHPAEQRQQNPGGEQPHEQWSEGEEEEQDEPQRAWDAWRELYRHSPGIMLGSAASLGGSVVGGSQHGVSGGHARDVIMGGNKTEIIYQFGAGAEPASASGVIPGPELDRLTAVFAGGEEGCFDAALNRLRTDRVVVLTGASSTGRRSAALMLLRELGATPVRTLDPAATPGKLPQLLGTSGGHVVCDLVTGHDRALREHQLRAMSDELRAHEGYLVITTGPHPVLDNVPAVAWRPAPAESVLRAHLRHLVDDESLEAELLGLEPTEDFLAHRHLLHDVAAFARLLTRYGQGEAGLDALHDYSLATVEQQVREWFDGLETSLHDKAFLISLAAFDRGPYPLTAELSDDLFALLQHTEDPEIPPRIPVFGTSTAKRLELARADRYEEQEETEWGPFQQTKAGFRDARVPLVLLREVWTGHPSARPGVVTWLRRLADDGRPLVRTRAAATAAVLAVSDLPSAMALLIHGWATARRFRVRLAAANALALAHHLGAPNVPRILHDWCTSPDIRLRWTAVRAYALAGDGFPGEALTALVSAAGQAPQYATGPGIEEEYEQLAQSLSVLLLSDAVSGARSADGFEDEPSPRPSQSAPAVPGELLRLLDKSDRQVRDVICRAFLYACEPTDSDPEDDEAEAWGRPLLLDRAVREAGFDGQREGDPDGPGRQGRDAHTTHTTRSTHTTHAGDAPYQHQLAALWQAVLNDRVHAQRATALLRTWVRLSADDPDAEHALACLLPLLAVTDAGIKRLDHLLRRLQAADDGPPSAVAGLLATLPSMPDKAPNTH